MGLKKTGDTAVAHRVEAREYPRDFDGLLAQLADAEPTVRRWAARDLAGHAQAGASLCQRLAVEPDASVRTLLFTSIAQLGGSAAVAGLLPLLRSEDAALRNGAIEVLSGLPDAVAPRIDALLHDTDSDVRIFTLNLLGNLPHARVPQWLGQVLRAELEPNVIGAALEVAVEVGGRELLEDLRSARIRFHDDPYIAFAADLALARIESE